MPHDRRCVRELQEGGALLGGVADHGTIHGIDSDDASRTTPDQPEETRSGFIVRVADGTKALDVAQREKCIAQRWAGAQ